MRDANPNLETEALSGCANINRRKFCAALSAGLLCGLTSITSLAQQSNEPRTAPKLRIAVMDLSGSALKLQQVYQPGVVTTTQALPPPAGFALGLTEMLTTALTRSGQLVVLERVAADKVIGEQDFGASGRVNPETAAAQGKIIGAQLLVTGDITEFSYQQSSVGGNVGGLRLGGLSVLSGLKSNRVTAMVALDVRVIDAVTGEVIFSQRTKGTSSMTGVSSDITAGSQSFSVAGSVDHPLGKASREAIEKVAALIVSNARRMPCNARIVDVRNDRVYLNAGTDAGIRSGMEFDVYEQQEALIDPATGRNLGTPDRLLGSIRVETVQDSYAVAVVVRGTGFKRNHLLRASGQKEMP